MIKTLPFISKYIYFSQKEKGKGITITICTPDRSPLILVSSTDWIFWYCTNDTKRQSHSHRVEERFGLDLKNLKLIARL